MKRLIRALTGDVAYGFVLGVAATLVGVLIWDYSADDQVPA